MDSPTIRVPITLEQLIDVVRHLNVAERSKVAEALLETELQADMADLIAELYAEPAADDVSDDEIMAEIRAVRQQN